MVNTTVSKKPTVHPNNPAPPSKADICGVLRYVSESQGTTTYEEIANGCLTVFLLNDDGSIADQYGQYTQKGNQFNVVGPHSFQCGC